MENYPLHKEKYYLTGDTFHTFMRDRLEKDLKREKNGYKMLAIALFAATAAVLYVIYFTGSDVRNDLVWNIIPILLVVIALTNFRKMKMADKGLDNTIIKDYQTQGFAKYQITVKFYEDRLTYQKGDVTEEYQYNTFKKYYEAEKYFAIYFTTGDIVIFNGNCKSEKIKEVIGSYLKGVKE